MKVLVINPIMYTSEKKYKKSCINKRHNDV